MLKLESQSIISEFWNKNMNAQRVFVKVLNESVEEKILGGENHLPIFENQKEIFRLAEMLLQEIQVELRIKHVL